MVVWQKLGLVNKEEFMLTFAVWYLSIVAIYPVFVVQAILEVSL